MATVWFSLIFPVISFVGILLTKGIELYTGSVILSGSQVGGILLISGCIGFFIGLILDIWLLGIDQ